MRNLLRFLGTSFLLLLAVIVIFGINFLVHEFGHCITMDLAGGKCEGVYAPPGVKLWPLDGLGDPYPYPEDWDNSMGRTVYDEVPPMQKARGFVSFAGSGSTALLSFVAMLALWILEPRGWGRTLLMIEALFFGDLLFYTILPEWFGLRHLFLWGGDYPEPLEGAVSMGFEREDVIATVLAFSAAMFLAWLGYALRSWMMSRVAGQGRNQVKSGR
ncbi:MAG: hypothetical protein AB1554_13655 [Chloroflexota bacterium]